MRWLVLTAVVVALTAVGILRAQEENGGTAQRQADLAAQASTAYTVLAGRTTVLEGYLHVGPAAPFTCGAATAGAYVDTTCGQLCVCLPGSAKWGRSDTGALGSATDCCV